MMIASTGFTLLASEGGAAAEDAPVAVGGEDPPQNCHQGLPEGGEAGVVEVWVAVSASPVVGNVNWSCVLGLR